jgi:hypothetical protein
LALFHPFFSCGEAMMMLAGCALCRRPTCGLWHFKLQVKDGSKGAMFCSFLTFLRAMTVGQFAAIEAAVHDVASGLELDPKGEKISVGNVIEQRRRRASAMSILEARAMVCDDEPLHHVPRQSHK